MTEVVSKTASKSYDRIIHIIVGVGIGIFLTAYVLPSIKPVTLDERLVLTDNIYNKK